MIIYPFNNYN